MLVLTVGIKEGPMVRVGSIVTILRLFSSPYLNASFSASAFDTPYPCQSKKLTVKQK
jgi:hypothetical protein